MKETSKSVMRRLHDSRFVSRFFVGEGIDVGCGTDPISLYAELFPLMKTVKAWDVSDGDAQFLASVKDETFDFVHSSHCLEHLVDPAVALGHWFRVLKPGGYLVMLLPDEDLYEMGTFPSRVNPDHKWTFTLYKESSWSGRSVNVVDLIKTLGGIVQPVKLELLDASHRYGLPAMDQTLTPVGECAIEVVLRKRCADEVTVKGRLPPPGGMTLDTYYALTGIRIPVPETQPPAGPKRR